MFFAEYSLLAMFDTYPASKCTTQNMYTRICAGLVVIVSLRTALGSLKEEEDEEDEQFAWADDFKLVPNFRNVLSACAIFRISSGYFRLASSQIRLHQCPRWRLGKIAFHIADKLRRQLTRQG